MSTSFLSEETIRNYEFDWFKMQLKMLSNGKYEISKWSKNEYYSIISDDKWSDISFHFELNWRRERGLPITKVTNIDIPIHLETKEGNEEKYNKAREYFEAQGYSFKGKKEGAILASDGSKFHTSIAPDFSSEEAAKKTILEIIKILNSAPYQKCAEIVNAFISDFQSKK